MERGIVNSTAQTLGSATKTGLQKLEDTLTGTGPISDLRAIDEGRLKPDPDSRLGAYDATKGYKEGTVGHSVHNAIGTIYAALGTTGEEKIGTVFNSPEAKKLYDQPVNSDASKKIAQMEYDYWAKTRKDNPWSVGGFLGTQFGPGTRDWLQKNIFN